MRSIFIFIALFSTASAIAGTNPWFVQAFLAGLNHEMGRELLWRGFPTDQRGTCFRRFWDRPGPDADDITAMTEWDPADPLGQAGTLHNDPQLVLVLRADLLRRYPRAVIYAARAAWNGAPDPAPALPATTEERYPVFSGALAPDVTFLGFDLSPEDARGSDTDPGWYLVLAEPPGEVRYGIDDDAPTAPTGTWADLSWDVVGTDAPGYVVLGATDPLDPANDPRDLHFSTEATSAQIAAVLEQRSYRVAIHARKLLPETS